MNAAHFDLRPHATTFTTLMGVLDARARETPERIVYRFLREGELETESLDFAELRRRALEIAARLSSLGAAGERAILLYPQGLSFLCAFFGCLYAGVVAVPVSPPNRKRGLGVLRRVADDADANWLLSTGEIIERISSGTPGGSLPERLSCVASDGQGGEPPPWAPPEIHPKDVALLQYTSGSTGLPRGVVVTHENLVDNHRQVAASLGGDSDSKYLSWLPMFHDMGLGIALQAVWVGGEAILMPPRSFVHDPRRWLEAISRHGATISGGPDFAYELCTRRISPGECDGLDLRSWRVAYNGSEPVSAQTIARFSDAFARTGFRREAFQPVYGLAEATLLVSSEPPSEPPVVQHFATEALERGEAVSVSSDRGRALVSLGRPWPGMRVAIVDPRTRDECSQGRVGEIWIRGRSVAAGYFQRDSETRATFAASTARGSGCFLRSGDLGFIADGRLFVTGRRRDVLVLGDRTLYPQDIEATASHSHPALSPHGAAAFSLGTGESVVVVQEVSRGALRSLDAAQVVDSIRAAIRREHGLDVSAVALIKPATLPRTTSGKVQRARCRAAYLEQSLSFLLPPAATPATAMKAAASSARDEGSQATLRADRLIEWLRRNASDLIACHESSDTGLHTGALLRDLSKTGLLGMQVDSALGGLGLTAVDALRVIEQLAAIDFRVAMSIALHESLGVLPIARHASSTLKSWLLPGLLQAEETPAFAYCEPGGPVVRTAWASRLQTDSAVMFRLSGKQAFEAVVDRPTAVTLLVAHGDRDALSAFVVLGRDVRLQRAPEEVFSADFGIAQGMLSLDGVLVGREHLLGELGSGQAIAHEALRHARLSLAAACVGAMKRCAQLVSRTSPYRSGVLSKRTPNPVTLSRLGSIKARVTALGCLVARVAGALDAGAQVPDAAFVAFQLLGPELLLKSIEDLLQLGFALSPADRERSFGLHRDAGLLQNYGGSPEGVAEGAGGLILSDARPLVTFVSDVFAAPELAPEVERFVEAIRFRRTKLNPALAQRAQRWAQTRAGELASWVLLVAALVSSERKAPSPELRHAHAWARAEFEFGLAAVRFGTPSEAAAIDSADVASTFAAYAQAVGDP